MNQKPGRNDPCPCGSGKKFKACCADKNTPKSQVRPKLTAKWLNAPVGPDLMERTFGKALQSNQLFSKVNKDEVKKDEANTEEGET